MSKIISVHSFRGGTGKSNSTANLATLLAMEGYRIGVVDTDIQSPGIHVLFGLDESKMARSLNDYLWGKCEIQETAHNVTANLGTSVRGQIYLVPSSLKPGEIARVLREGYDVSILNDGFHNLIRALNLDVLMIDTHPGLNEETLLSIAISDVLVIIMRPDQQDYQGTGVTVEVARKLGVPRMQIIVNKVPAVFPIDEVKARTQDTYQVEIAAVLPHSDDMMALASGGIFALRYPDHPITDVAQAGRQTAAPLSKHPSLIGDNMKDLIEFSTPMIADDIQVSLTQWRRRILDSIITFGCIVGLPAIGFILYDLSQNWNDWPVLGIVVLYGLLVVLGFARKVDQRLRSCGVLFIFYVIGIIGFARGGLAGSGRIFMLTLPIIALILLNVPAGILMTALSILTTVAFAILAQVGALQGWLIYQEKPAHTL